MKRLFVLFMMTCAFVISINAQKINIKKVEHLTTDTWGLRNARKDTSGKNCAVVRVGVIGVKDMEFPQAIGDVAHIGSEYFVYIPESSKNLKYKYKNGSISGTIDFSKYADQIGDKGSLVQGHVYLVEFDTENHIRGAIFSVKPENATLIFNGEKVSINADGLAVIEKPIGSYSYRVEAQGYEPQSGTVKLTESEISTTTDITLEARQYPLSIRCTPPNASLFIDDVPYGELNQNSDLMIAEGSRNIRLVAVGYDDYEQTLIVNKDVNLNITLNQKKQEVVKFNEERTRTRVNVRPGYYITGGGALFDKKKYLAQQWGLSINLAAMQHFGGIFAIREGLGLGVARLDKELMKEAYEALPTDSSTIYFDVPLQLGFSIPFGPYNKNLFSIMGGGYGKYMSTKTEQDSKGKTSKDEWDYGLRASAIIDIKHFTIGADVSTSLNGLGIFFGVNIGVKMY